MSSFPDETQARREVAQLHRLAMDAHDEAQYVTMERLLEQAVATAQRLQDLPLVIEERFWLATSQRMQNKKLRALTTFTWLIGLATDPAASHEVTDENSLEYLARAFTDFVECGRFLPEMPVEQLQRVLSDGLQWLERIGKSHWAAGFRLQRGLLFKNQGDLQGARLELEAALALKRRHPEAPGYTLGTHLLQFADVLRTSSIGAYSEAIALADEALTAKGSSPYVRRGAYKTQAYAYLELKEYEYALHAARESLALAQTTESAEAISQAYEVLGRIHREVGQVQEAAGATAQNWRWARRQGSVEYRNNALADCTRARLLQARAACGLPATEKALPDQLPADANRVLATRRVQSARRFLGWAQPLSAQLDRATGRRSYQDELDELRRKADQLVALLAKETLS